MRFSVTASLASATLILTGLATSCARPEFAASAAASTVLHDPLLGLSFEPNSTGFEPAPPELNQRCPELANERYFQQLWVFAEAEQANQRYLIVAGQFTPRIAGLETIENAQGALLRLGREDCTLIGPAKEIFLMPDAYDVVPSSVHLTLAQDAAKRLARAHGGVEGLAAAMRSQNVTSGHLPPVIASAIADLPDPAD
ncbi:hypothetical protein [Tsuneonella sp. SYSU-LHT278]|uniref:hypothetical protein n=1 Tax=Tsuneonella sediminis TaxID=3416089 RepID=UPI003F79D10F